MASEAGMHLAEPMREALVVLGAAAIVIPLFQRVRVSPVVGFMLVGLIAGPSGLGALAGRLPWLAWFTIADRERIAPVAELGVVLLLFAIGLELSWERIWSARRLVFGLGASQVAACTALVGLGAYALGVAPKPAVILGLALAMSSTAVVTQVLAEGRRITGRVGRTSFAMLLFQDLAVVPVLFALGVLGGAERGGLVPFLFAVGQALAAIAVLVALGRLGLRPLFRSVARTESPELFMAACLLVVLVTALSSEAAGMSMALGALIAGLLLAETEYRRQIEVTVEPFKGLLLGVFLISIGLNFDLARVAAHPAAVLGAAAGLVGIKFGLIAGLARLYRVRWPIAVQAGLLLGPAGEFSFVVLGTAAATGLISGDVAGFALAVAALTMAAIPALAWVGQVLTRPPPAKVPADMLPPEAAEAALVIIAGFGRVGRTVASMLDAHGIGYIALDSSVERVAQARRTSSTVYFGDVTQIALLRRVGLMRARALVVTIDDRARVDALVQMARAARPDLLIVARARDARHAAHLYEVGATDAVPETIEASLQLSEAVLVDLGLPMGPILVSIHEKRAQFQSEIRSMVPHIEVRQRGRSRLRQAAPEG